MKTIKHDIKKTLKRYGKTPAHYLATLMQKNDIILLGEHHAIKDNIQCLIDAIPFLYDAGMDYLGMEFGCEEDQAQLNELLTASTFNEAKARTLLFNYNTLFAYKDYLAIYKAVFTFNQTLPKGKRKLLILNLSYRYQWNRYDHKASDFTNLTRVFHRGGTESFRFNIINNAILKENKKMLALVGNIHAYTQYHMPVVDYLAKNFIRHEQRHLGHLLNRLENVKIKTVLFHEYVLSKDGQSYIEPCNGLMENIMCDIGLFPMGFDLNHKAFNSLKDNSFLSLGYDNFTLPDLADGYIYIKPLTNRSGASIDYNFLDGKTLNDVLTFFPDPTWHQVPNNLDEYWQLVKAYVDLDKRYCIKV